MTKKPNIVLFVPDSYRGDVLGHQGNPGALTPNLDALVANGAVSYSHAFAQNPVCTPSRCSFMTGWYPHVHGHRSMRYMLGEHEPSLLSVLRREGYTVWWGGKNDLVRVREREDYLRYCDVKFWPAGKYIEHMEYRQPPPLAPDDPRHGAFYRGVLTRNGEGAPHWDQDTAWVLGAVDMIVNWSSDRPFLCYLPLGKPHPAYYAEEDYYNAIDPERLPPRIPAPGEGANLPEVLDALRAEYRNDGNRRHLTELLDITATLYDLLSIDPGYAHQGVSLRASLAGEETPIHDAVFAEVGGRKNEEGFVNTDVKKMPPDSFYARQGRAAIPYHEAGSHAVMCRTMQYKYIRRYYTGHHELFDLEADPGETRNLCGHPDYADVARRMETRLLDFFMRTTDVLPHEPDSRQV